jgi:hypothetical protein
MFLFIKVSALHKRESVLIFPGLLRTEVPILSMPVCHARLFAIFIDNKHHIRSEGNVVPER